MDHREAGNVVVRAKRSTSPSKTMLAFDAHKPRPAEAELQASEHKLKLFVEYAPAAIAMFDREMRYIAASRRYLSDYRLGNQSIIGKSHYEVFPEIPERWKEIHRRCLAGASERADEDPFPRKDGTVDWVRWEIHPWYEKAGKTGGIILFSEVITERIQAEKRIQQSNLELMMAYDATITGWSYAMDLRDQETKGHTQRVTDLTLRLAEKMGLRPEDTVHIRRGALLHDIGKLGVPDHVLLKPGELNEEEAALMRKHPTYAYEMLAPIHYLQNALDIPYCHHEHWDGSGYPRGLKGEQIPLAARLFAIVDVWDALTSDRPYRTRWSEEQTRLYILEQSGKQFDPQVVKVFLTIIDADLKAKKIS